MEKLQNTSPRLERPSQQYGLGDLCGNALNIGGMVVPPPLALSLTVLLIGYLLVRESRQVPRVSLAVWIPIVWLIINGSRQASQWLESGPRFSAQTLMEGNSLDKALYSFLMCVGVIILLHRKDKLIYIIRNNSIFVIFVLYALLSVIWSDYPLISLKRWFKALGDPIMVLVLCTDPYPVRAITTAIRRCAYFLIPLSILFCKYYENMGRVFDSWGKASYTGVALDKNMFGYILFAYGLYFVAALISEMGAKQTNKKKYWIDKSINLMFVIMVAWLLPVANSKTATLALAAGVTLVYALRFAIVRNYFWYFTIGGILLVTVTDELFSVKSAILEASGRDATFTGRTGLWETVLQEPINPLLGAGYASFWLGERLTRFWAMYPTSPPIQAHNGYIEVYLNLGIVGLFLIAAVLWKGLKSIQARALIAMSSGVQEERTLGVFGMAYGASYLLYNITEATFQGLNPLFTIFLLLSFGYLQPSTTQDDGYKRRLPATQPSKQTRQSNGGLFRPHPRRSR